MHKVLQGTTQQQFKDLFTKEIIQTKWVNHLQYSYLLLEFFAFFHAATTLTFAFTQGLTYNLDPVDRWQLSELSYLIL